MNDLDRIINLPEKWAPTQGEIDQAHDILIDRFALRKPGSTARLRPVQVEALMEIWAAGGLFGCIGVGYGKTLITFLAPLVLRAKSPLLFVPALVLPRTREMYQDARRDWNLVPMSIQPYSQLSLTESNLFERVVPDLILLDEAHYLQHMSSARTKRVVRFLRAHQDCRVVALSGTMLTRSVTQCWHIAEMALHDGTPFPRDRYTRDEWARILDVPKVDDPEPEQSDWISVEPLKRWACKPRGMSPGGSGLVDLNESPRQVARACFRERLRATPGVVVTSESDVGCSLRFVELQLADDPHVRQVNELIARFINQRHDGLIFEAIVDRWRYHMQLSLGWSYRLQWPGAPDYEWIDARNTWARQSFQLLEQLENQGIDTPMQLANAIEAGRIGGDVALAWVHWKAIRDRVEPFNVVDWLYPQILDVALEQTQEATHEKDSHLCQSPYLVWYGSEAVEARLRAMGLEVYGAGEVPPLTPHSRLTCLSWHCHAQGYNLQAGWAHNLILEPPSSGQVWEQMIGRTHRLGQQADEVVVKVAAWTSVQRGALKRAREEARFVEQSQGMSQRLCYADKVKV